MQPLQLYPAVNDSGITDYTINIHIKTSTCGNQASIQKVYLVGGIIFALGKITKHGMAEALDKDDVSLTIKLPPNTNVTGVRRYFIGANLMRSQDVTVIKNEEEFLKQVRYAIPAHAQ